MAEYRIVDRIGQGGMGIVYRAVQEPLDRPVAIKILPSSMMATSGSAVPRFLREIQACTKLTHPNIIRIIDCGEMSGQPFFAMDFLEAQTLKEMLADSGPLPSSQVAEIFRQMLEALEYCHKEGMIHRDIKPHNIMVDHSNHATLMDFGLVKMLERSGITHSKRLVGSPNYMPPEMIQGKEIGVQADLWSLGCVVYELLTGERAFPGKVIRDIGLLILKSEPVPVTAKRPDCPVGLAQILAGCLKKEVRDRYQQAEHVLKDLVRVETGRPPMGPLAHGDSTSGLPLEAPAPPPVPAAAPSRPTRKNPLAPRATAKAPVHSTLTNLPVEPPARRLGLRSLVPRTWLERLVAAGLLVVAVLAMIVGTVVRVTRAPRAGQVTDMRQDVGHDSVELTWTSPDAYRAVATVARSDGSGEPAEVRELAERTQHRMRVGGLERGVGYALTVKADDRVVYRAVARTLAPLDLAERLEAAVRALEPAGLTAKLEADLASLTPRDRTASPRSARFREVRDRHARKIAERLLRADVGSALNRFRPHRHEFFLSPEVPAARKRSLWLGMEALEDLRLLATAVEILTVPAAVEGLSGAGFGPVPEGSIASPQVLAVKLTHAGQQKRYGADAVSVLLYTRTGYPDSQAIQKGEVVEPHANLLVDLSLPVTLPTGVKRLELGISAALGPFSRVTLWAGANRGALTPVAVFRGTPDQPSWSCFAIDPRLFDGPQYLRLELAASESMTPLRQQSVTVRALTFRYAASEGK